MVHGKLNVPAGPAPSGSGGPNVDSWQALLGNLAGLLGAYVVLLVATWSLPGATRTPWA
ncbi:hypothetical protein [Arthrobacter livingstonensis]|uniref:hypothetical protein n=1 Tax=Arthrobacter livingstonensis TaxID=670078 RepID=UPI0014760E15|nr:hypothetical protein [Arthrobacter livingstonensis]